MWIEGPRVRIDATAFTGKRSALIYSMPDQKLWFVDYATRTYMEFDEPTLRKVGERTRSAVDFFKDSWARLRNAPASRPKVTVIDGKETKTLNDRPAARYQVLSDANALQDLWVTPWDRVGMPKQSFSTVLRLASFYGVLISLGDLPVLDGIPHVAMDGVLQTDGYPVELRQAGEGGVVYRVTLGLPKKSETDPSEFRLPGGFSRQFP
jgi:hypothetical protein